MLKLDAQGRFVEAQTGNLAAATFQYDSLGRLKGAGASAGSVEGDFDCLRSASLLPRNTLRLAFGAQLEIPARGLKVRSHELTATVQGLLRS